MDRLTPNLLKSSLAAALVIGILGRGLVNAQEPSLSVPEPIVAVETTLPELNLETLEQWALERNPTLAQAAAQIDISRSRAWQAGLYPNPTVGYTAETAGELQGAFIQQEFMMGGKLRLSRAKFQQEAAVAEAQLEAQEYRVVSSVRKAFYRTLATQRQVEVRQELLKNAEDALATTKALVNVGQANRPDLLQAEVQVSRIRAELSSAERRYEGHWQELVAYVGIPDLPQAPLSGQLEIAEDETLDRETMLNELLACSPQLRAAWAEVVRDRIGVQRERVEPIPNVDLRVEAGYNFVDRETVAGASVGIKLPLYDKNQGTIAQARAELMRAEAEVARIELSLRQKFGDVFSDYESDLVQARSFEQDVLPKAREAYETYLASFQNRRAAWPQVLVAQREYFQLSDEYIEILMDLRRAEAEITGMFLGDGLEQPQTPEPEGHREATPRPR